MRTKNLHQGQRVPALLSDLNTRDQALGDAAAENNERELSRRSWFDEAQRLEKECECLQKEVAKFRDWQESHRANYFKAASERDTLHAHLAERDALLRRAAGFIKLSAERLPRKHQTIRSHAVQFIGEVEAALSAGAEPAAPRITPSPFAFVYVHPQTAERHTVTVTRDEVAKHMEEQLFQKLCECFCECQPIGETNVVDCCCDEVGEQFELVKEEQARAALEPKP